MKIHGETSSSVAEAGCYAISNLAANDDINNEKLGSCGACEIVIELLKALGKTNINVAEAGCLAVCNLAFIESNQDKLGICTIVMELWHMYIVQSIESNNKKLWEYNIDVAVTACHP